MTNVVWSSNPIRVAKAFELKYRISGTIETLPKRLLDELKYMLSDILMMNMVGVCKKLVEKLDNIVYMLLC